jgi:hypothetical protein
MDFFEFYMSQQPAPEAQLLPPTPPTSPINSPPPESEEEPLIIPRKRKPSYRYPDTNEVIMLLRGIDLDTCKEIASDFIGEEIQTAFPNASAKIMESSLIRIYPDKYEKREKARKYRQEHKTTKTQKELTEEQKKKNKEYNQREDVVSAKRVIQMARRQWTRLQKERDPEAYEKDIEKLIAQIDAEYANQRKRKKMEGSRKERSPVKKQKVSEK